MQYRKDAEVITSGGKIVGEIERVVIEPKSMEVTHLVVRKGLIFTSDKVVPVDRIESATEDKVVLKKGVETAQDLPDFVEVDYIPVEEPGSPPHPSTTYAEQSIWYRPSPSSAWWGAYPGYPVPPYVAKSEHVNIPEGTVAVAEGARVISSDEKDIGKVERVYTDPRDHRVTDILITKGLLTKERKLIPSAWIDRISEGEIHLKVWWRFIEKLPEFIETKQDQARA